MVEFKIAPSNTGIIAQTFKKIKEITASGSIDIDTPVRILLAAGKYEGEARRALAVRYGHLLSYSDEAIERYLKNNTELE